MKLRMFNCKNHRDRTIFDWNIRANVKIVSTHLGIPYALMDVSIILFREALSLRKIGTFTLIWKLQTRKTAIRQIYHLGVVLNHECPRQEDRASIIADFRAWIFAGEKRHTFNTYRRSPRFFIYARRETCESLTKDMLNFFHELYGEFGVVKKIRKHRYLRFFWSPYTKADNNIPIFKRKKNFDLIYNLN
jgi:hypothetical protein